MSFSDYFLSGELPSISYLTIRYSGRVKFAKFMNVRNSETAVKNHQTHVCNSTNIWLPCDIRICDGREINLRCSKNPTLSLWSLQWREGRRGWSSHHTHLTEYARESGVLRHGRGLIRAFSG
jgi:hypothetical protein